MSQYNINVNYQTKVAFDVDGCLIHFDDTPNYNNIDLFNKFVKIGCYVIVWSGGGRDYAEHWSNKLGLRPNEIRDKLDKWDDVDLAFDDEKINLAKINILI